MISVPDLKWLAGFIEGEGSFVYNGSFTISANQVQRWPLEECVRIAGGKIYPVSNKSKKTYAQPAWIWCRTGPGAIEVARLLENHMSPRRRDQLLTALGAWMAKPGRQLGCRLGHPYVGRQCPQCIAERQRRTQHRRNALQRQRRWLTISR